MSCEDIIGYNNMTICVLELVCEFNSVSNSICEIVHSVDYRINISFYWVTHNKISPLVCMGLKEVVVVVTVANRDFSK